LDVFQRASNEQFKNAGWAGRAIVSTSAIETRTMLKPPKPKSAFAYKTVLALSILYYSRPEDVIPGLSHIPMAKIAGGLALIALVFGVRRERAVKKWPVEVKLLFVMLAHMILTIPFAYWRAGAFQTVFSKFAKGVIVALLVTVLVTSMRELKKLLWVQAASLAVMTLASVLTPHHGRMGGVLGGVFENPNDLAINIALNWPLCFGFFLLTDKGWKKALWAGGMFIMVVGVVLTYSRSGFLAILVCGLVSLYQFGLKGRRIHLVAGAGVSILLLAIAAPVFGLYPKIWIARMESTVMGRIKDSYDQGSREAREELMKESFSDMVTHPVFGVGPGNFGSFSGTWRVAHNTYTELGAEAGFPAIFLFLLVLWRAFTNLRRVQKSAYYKTDLELQIFTGAMLASFFAYLVGAAFSDTQYELFPYFMIGYTTALYHMACVIPLKKKVVPNQNTPETRRRELNYGESGKRDLAWTR
jgi:putative inorganic carbon (hco3(-)) transporter